jgi:hypothetical protein
MAPEFNASCGAPVTVTGPLNATVTGITAPALYAPLATVEETPDTDTGTATV